MFTREFYFQLDSSAEFAKPSNMAGSFAALKIRDLQQLERALETRIQLLKSFNSDDHKNNALFLTLAAYGMRMKYKGDLLKIEIEHCEILLDRIQVELLSR